MRNFFSSAVFSSLLLDQQQQVVLGANLSGTSPRLKQPTWLMTIAHWAHQWSFTRVFSSVQFSFKTNLRGTMCTLPRLKQPTWLMSLLSNDNCPQGWLQLPGVSARERSGDILSRDILSQDIYCPGTICRAWSLFWRRSWVFIGATFCPGTNF